VRIVLLRDGDLEVTEEVVTETGPLSDSFCQMIHGLDSLSIQTRIPQLAGAIRVLSRVNLSVTGTRAYKHAEGRRELLRECHFIENLVIDAFESWSTNIHLPPETLFVDKVKIRVDSESTDAVKLVRTGVR